LTPSGDEVERLPTQVIGAALETHLCNSHQSGLLINFNAPVLQGNIKRVVLS
jgi:hypothetical protein